MLDGMNHFRVGYVVKRYPRYSETFIVNEILAHEKSGLGIEIFSLRPPVDTHFQGEISQVKASVTYLSYDGIKSEDFWAAVENTSEVLPDIWGKLKQAKGEHHKDVYQAVVLAGEVRRRNIHHLHAHFATSATTVVRLAAFFSGITYTFTAHAKDIYHESVNSNDLKEKIKNALGVITVSDYNVRYLKENFGDESSAIRRIYNGLDLNKFSYQKPKEGSLKIISVGRLVEKKGFKDLIEACAILKQKKWAFLCEIVGTGELENELRMKIELLGVADCVKLLGPRPQHELIECLRDAAMFVAPCVVGADGNQDGLPTVILEAMALGVPCISTDVTGIPEMIIHQKTGMIVGQHNPQELAESMGQLLVDYAQRVNFSHEARKLMETNFDIHQNTIFIRELFLSSRKAGVIQ